MQRKIHLLMPGTLILITGFQGEDSHGLFSTAASELYMIISMVPDNPGDYTALGVEGNIETIFVSSAREVVIQDE